MLGLGLSSKTRFGTRTIDLKYSADVNTGCVRYLNVLKEVHILNGMTSQPFEIQTFGCHLGSLLFIYLFIYLFGREHGRELVFTDVECF